MILYPALDLKAGQCVRLYQGDYDRVTTYSADPVEMALRWQDAGASWLHIVDLDGAKAGHPVNSSLIARICQATTLKVQVGGGLRTLAAIEQTLASGAERAILGTIVVTDRELLDQALQCWGNSIVVGLDARDGLVAISGWREMSTVKATTLARELVAGGVHRFIYTDIARDGAMQGPNRLALREMLETTKGTGTQLIAAGGVSSLADLQKLAELKIEGAIIGKAIYNGAIDLARAIHLIEDEQSNEMGSEPC